MSKKQICLVKAARGFEWKQESNPMELREDDQEVVGFEAVNEDQWPYRLNGELRPHIS